MKKEFDYTQTTLDKLITFGKTYSFSRAHEGEGEVRHIHYGDIHTKLPSIIKKSDVLPTIREKEDFQFVSYGDILVADASEDYKDLGKATCYLDNKKDSKVIAGLHTHRLNVDQNKTLPSYLINLFQTHRYRKFVWKMGTGISVLGLSKSNLGKYPVAIPNMQTQQKVASLFECFNGKIQLQQQKINLLKEQKKGFMQKIFKQGIRFKDEDGGDYLDWKYNELENVFNIIDGDRGKNYPSEDDFFDSGHTLFLDTKNVTKNGFKFDKRKFITKEKSEKMTKGLLERNDIVLTSRGSIGNIALYDETIEFNSIRINSAMLILRLSVDDIDLKFAYHLLKSKVIKDFIRSSSVGSAQPHITKKDLKTVKVFLPASKEEQIKIANFLTKLDEKIELEQQKLGVLQEQKQGFMQRLFI
ncbi:hypothetical protein BHL51_12855 [Bacillus cereus]|uniref:restriction endonuclease subunit S n=1 Tax=Bacillus cereus TaxID=1396 RepID=UPI000995A586|nr:restriction endonuclease subunit S [Bacillus cereus]OOZ99814.1 hypothetical protein BHL51_12855 [Bacillus cereus]